MIRTYLDSLSSSNIWADSIKLCRRGMFLVLLIQALCRWPIVADLYGPDTTMIHQALGETLSPFLLKINILLGNYPQLIYTIYTVVLLCGILGLSLRFTSLVAWVFLGIFGLKGTGASDGGDSLLWVFMFLFMFMKEERNGSYLSNAASNLAVVIARYQICIVYAVAGIAKMRGELWTKGVALYYVLKVKEFSHPLAQEFLSNNLFFITAGTLMTLAFQLLFPSLVWFRKTRYLMLTLGTLIHLQIAFVMGLPSFGLALTMSYFIFYDEQKAAKVLALIQKASFIIANVVYSDRSMTPIIVAFDDNCGICQTTRTLLLRTSRKGLLFADSAINPVTRELSQVSSVDRLRTIHAFCPETGQLYKGFDVFTQAALRNKVFFLFYPLMRFLKMIGLGDYIYAQVSQSKVLRPCYHGSCRV